MVALPVVAEIIFVKESDHSQSYPKERGTQPRTAANLTAFQHLQMISLHPLHPLHPLGPTEVYIFFFQVGLEPDQCSSVLHLSPLEGAHTGHEDLSRWWGKARSPISLAAHPLEASVSAGHLDARRCATHPKSHVCSTHPRASCDILPSSQSRECSQQCRSVNTHFMEKNWETFSFVGNFSWIIFI